MGAAARGEQEHDRQESAGEEGAEPQGAMVAAHP
jgi:hypothetical protein